MTVYYIDLDSGSDSNDGTSWAQAWLTITSGANVNNIGPGDEIRVSKTPDPVSIGSATWTDLSATVTLSSAQTATVDNCESIWTANGTGDTTVSLETTERKQKDYERN